MSIRAKVSRGCALVLLTCPRESHISTCNNWPARPMLRGEGIAEGPERPLATGLANCAEERQPMLEWGDSTFQAYNACSLTPNSRATLGLASRIHLAHRAYRLCFTILSSRQRSCSLIRTNIGSREISWPAA